MSTIELRAAVERARRLLVTHPHIIKITDQADDVAGIALTIHVRTNLPFAWEATGQSPNGVRAIEPVRMYFPSTYAIEAPSFALRPDFDRSLAHVLPNEAHEAPQPCIFEGNTTELLHAAGLPALIDHLVSWLEDAALDRLINNEQGWEPVRRDALTHTVTMDADHLRGLVTKNGGYALLNFVYAGTREGTYGEIQQASSGLHINSNPDAYLAPTTDAISAGRSVVLVVWPEKQPNGQPFVAHRYFPETIRDLQSLNERAAAYGLSTPLKNGLRYLERCIAPYRGQPVALCIVLCVRRPTHLIGTTSNIELLTYITHSGAPLFANGPTTPVLPALQRHAISTSLLRRLSGDSDAPAAAMALFGCGSLGSKIGLHLARRGMAPSDLVDNKYLSPHNAARHALVPDGRVQLPWLRRKVDALAGAIGGFGQTPRAHHRDIVRAIRTPEELRTVIAADTIAIVNTTAMQSVTEALAAAPIPLPRVIDAALLASGTVGALAVEGANRNPDIGDLLTETYTVLAREPDAGRIFAPHAHAVEVGHGCASLTTTMPDTRISMFAAPMSEVIARLATTSFSNQGVLMIGRLDDLNVTWQTHAIEPTIVVPVEGNTMRVRLGARAHAAIASDVGRYRKVETGGVLMGRYSEPAQCFYVSDVLPAPPDSKRHAALFVLGTKGLTRAIDMYASPTNYAVYCLGTWHSHLASQGASDTDRSTAALLSQTRPVPFVVLIHTPTGYRAIPATQM